MDLARFEAIKRNVVWRLCYYGMWRCVIWLVAAVESRCSLFRTSVKSHFNIRLSTLRDGFRRIGIRQRSWQDDFSSVLQFRRSLSAQLSCVFHEVRFTAIVPYTMGFIFRYVLCFVFLTVFVVYSKQTFIIRKPFFSFVLTFRKFLQPNWRFRFKLEFNALDGFISPK